MFGTISALVTLLTAFFPMMRVLLMNEKYLKPTCKALDVEIKVSSISAAVSLMPQDSNKTWKLTQCFDLGSNSWLQFLLI